MLNTALAREIEADCDGSSHEGLKTTDPFSADSSFRCHSSIAYTSQVGIANYQLIIVYILLVDKYDYQNQHPCQAHR